MISARFTRAAILGLAAAGAATVFSLDLALPLGVAAGVPYVAVVFLGFWLPGRFDVVLLATGATILTITGYFLSPNGGEFGVVLANRGLAIFAIWVTAFLLAVDRRRAERLRQSEARLRSQVMGNPVPIYTWRRDGNDFLLTDYNAAAHAATDGEVARLVGTKASEVGEAKPFLLEDLSRCWRERSLILRSAEFRLISTGEARRIEATYVYIPPDSVMVHAVNVTERIQAVTALREANERLEGRVAERTAALEDVNESLRVEMAERVAAETALQKSEESYRRLVEHAPEGVVVHDGSRNLFANAAAVRVLRAPSLQALLDADPMSFVRDEDWDEIRARRDMMLTGNVNFEPSSGIVRRLDGTEFHADRVAGSIVWDGRPAVQVIFRDITERVEAEEALRAAKEEAERANAAKSRFLAAASHDLRQPIQALNLFVHSLERKVRGDNVASELVGNIRMTTDVMSDLLNALLDISKLEAGVVTPEIHDFPVEHVLEDVRTTFALRAENTGIDLRIVPSSAQVRSDPALLERIVRNLVSNAIRYAESGRVLIGCRRRGETLRIEVWDNGIGIPESEMESIFEEFYQVANPARDRSKGLGLGLPIVRRTASLLGHPVVARSVLGKGSLFSIELPLLAVAERGGAELGADDRIDFLGGGDIVVIEDDAIVLAGLKELLAGVGFAVVAAGTADEAMARLRRTGATPDLIIADHRLDGGETGIRALERLQRAFGASIPGIIITGDTAPDRLREATDGGHRLLHKPVRAETLLSAVEEALPERARPLAS